MKKKRGAFEIPFDLQIFAGPEGGEGGNGDGGTDPGNNGGSDPKPANNEIEVEIDGKTYKYSKDSIATLHRDLHTTKSQLGDVKKTLTEIQNKGKSDLEILQTQHTDLQNNYRTVSKSNFDLTLELEARIQGLDLEDAKEIILDDKDTRETIAQKVKEKKEKIDKRLEDLIKEKGYAGTVIKPGSKDGAKKFIDGIYGEDGSKRKPRYEI